VAVILEKPAGKLGLELVAQRDRVVAVAEVEVLADCEVNERLNEQPVLDGKYRPKACMRQPRDCRWRYRRVGAEVLQAVTALYWNHSVAAREKNSSGWIAVAPTSQDFALGYRLKKCRHSADLVPTGAPHFIKRLSLRVLTELRSLPFQAYRNPGPTKLRYGSVPLRAVPRGIHST
jgi:hypothetical protein